MQYRKNEHRVLVTHMFGRVYHRIARGVVFDRLDFFAHRDPIEHSVSLANEQRRVRADVIGTTTLSGHM
jgi:hypothetical protein